MGVGVVSPHFENDLEDELVEPVTEFFVAAVQELAQEFERVIMMVFYKLVQELVIQAVFGVLGVE